MSADIRLYDSATTPVEVTLISFSNTPEGSDSSQTQFNARNNGDQIATSTWVMFWPKGKYTNTNGTPVVSISEIIRSSSDNSLKVVSVTDDVGASDSVYTVYTFTYPLWYYGAGTIIKKNAVTISSGFTINYNMGTVTFTSPNLSTDVITGTYTYKTPVVGTYNLTFPTTGTCSVNGATAVSIIADSATENNNVISGLTIIISSGLTTADTATIIISDMGKWGKVAPDSGGSPGSWVTRDYNLGNIAASAMTPFWIKLSVPSDAGSTGNTRHLNVTLEATTV